MKKRIIFISSILALSLLSSITTLEKEKVEATDLSSEKVKDEDWKTYAGLTENYIANENETYFAPLDTYGQHGAYAYKVHLDGLEVTCRAESLPVQSTSFGIYLSSSPNAYLGFPTISVWKGLYGGQTRVNVGEDHNYNNDPSIYVAPDLTAKKRFGLAASMVMQTANDITHAGFKVTFAKYNENWYTLTFTAVYDDSYIWTNNGTSYDASTKSCTVYAYANDFKNVIDNKGDCYVNYFGFDTNSKLSKFVSYISVNDNYRKAYQKQYVEVADTQLNNYIHTMQSVESVDQFKEALEIRGSYIESLSNLRKHDFYIYSKVKLEEADALVSPIVEKYAVIDVDSKIDIAAQAAKLLFQDEKQISDESINAFNLNIIDAEDTYNAYQSFLSQSKKEQTLRKLEEFKENKNYFISLQWVMKLEKDIQALPSSSTKGKDMESIIQWVDQDACRNNINVLSDEHKTLINQRIENDIQSFQTFKENNLLELAQYYLSELKALNQNGLSTKNNLSSAIQYLNYINSKLSFNESLNETYTNYIATRKEIVDASDAYIQSTIQKIEEMVESPIYKLEGYEDVKNLFKEFDFDFFIFEDSIKAAELKKSYNALKEKVTSNPLFYFTSNGEKNVEWGKNGVYFESIGSYPSRLNYNQALDVNKGISVTIRNEEMSFYNNGAKANNVSINFLNEDNSYKGQANGLNIVFWLYKATTIVRIYNKADGEIASVIINTPSEVVGDYVINLTKQEEASGIIYVLKVNEGTIRVSKSQLEDSGVILNDIVYFSMGSFLDDTTYTNSFSISEICGVDFKLPKEDIKRNDNTGDEPNPPTPNPDEPPTPGTSTVPPSTNVIGSSSNITGTSSGSNGNKGCRGTISGTLIAMVVGLVGMLALTKKKEEE